jgi:flagellar FliL protein
MNTKAAQLQKLLVFSLFVIIGLMLIITIIAFASGKASLGKNMRKADPSPDQFTSDEAVFTGFQQLRFATSDNPPVPVIITPYFTYQNGDTELNEELNMKMRHFRTVFSDYFSAHTQQELLELGEQTIKAELTEQINSELVLGKIKNLYFSEYIFLN